MKTALKTGRLRRFQWISVGLLVAVGMLFVLDRSTLSIANHDVAGDLQLSPIQMGLLLSAFSWAYAFSQLPVGILVDRVGTRLVLGAGVLLWAIAQVFTGFVLSLRQFLVARVLLGLGEAPTFPAGARMIADWFNKRERGGPTGIFLASTTLGPILAPPVLTSLLLFLGWRHMFIVLGALGIVLSTVWYAVVRNHRDIILSHDEINYLEENSAPAENRPTLKDVGFLLSTRSMWGIILGFVGVIYMIWLYLTWLPVYLEHERHFSIARVGWILSIPYIFGTLGNVFSGYLADNLLKRGISTINSRKYPICIGLVGSACFTIPVAYTPDPDMAVVYLCVVMFFLYLASAGAWALVSVVAPIRCTATVGALQNFGGYFGGSFAPVITGWLLETTYSFRASLVMSSVVALSAALIYFFLVRKPIDASVTNQAS